MSTSHPYTRPHASIESSETSQACPQSQSQSGQQMQTGPPRQREDDTDTQVWMIARRVCILIIVAVCVFAVGGVAFDWVGTASAASIDVSVNNNSGEVTVTPSGFEINGTEPVNVTVAGQTVIDNKSTSFNQSQSITFNIRNISNDRNPNLKSAKITLTVVNQNKTGSTNADLRYVEKGDGTPQITSDGIKIPSSTVIGVPEAEVPIQISQNGLSQTIIGEYRSNERAIVISSKAFLDTGVALTSDVNIRVLPDGSTQQYTLPTGQNPRLEITGSKSAQQQSISHPLITPDKEYTLTVQTQNPDGTYTQTQEVTDTQPLTVPVQVRFANTLNVTIEQKHGSDRNIIYDRRGAPNDVINIQSQRQTATWNTSTDQITVDSGSVASGRATLWIAQNDSYTQYSVSDVSSGINASAYPVPENGSVLLVGSDGIIWNVNITSASNAEGASQTSGGQSPNDSSGGLTATILSGDSPLLLMLSGILGVAVLGGASVVRRRQSLPRATNVGVGMSAVVFVLLFSWWARNVGSLPLTVLTTLLVSVVVGAGWSRLRTTSIAKDDIGAAMLSIIGGCLVVLIISLAAILIDMGEIRNPLYGLVYGLITSSMVITYLAIETGVEPAEQMATPSYQTGTLRIQLRDATGTPIEREVDVTIEHQSSTASNSQSISVSGGSETLSMRQGRVQATAIINGQQKRAKTSVGSTESRLTLRFDGQQVAVKTIDQSSSQDPNPIAGVDITAEVIDDSQKQSYRGQTDQRGQWRQQVPLSASEIEITADHNRYEKTTRTIAIGNGRAQTTIQMRQLVGEIHATVTIGDESVSAVPIIAIREETGDKAVLDPDASGSAVFKNAPIGSYTVKPDLSAYDEAFTESKQEIRVTDGDTERIELPISFDYRLPSGLSNRRRQLERRIDEIGSIERRDSAIPLYYASVLMEALRAVERLPSSGYQLLMAGGDVRPDAVAESLLDAIEMSADTVESVMTSKRNVDLFSACSNMTEVSITWRGSVDISRITSLAREDIGQQRSVVNEQIGEVDETVSSAVGEVAEVAPAREMVESVTTMIRDQNTADQVESAAFVVVAEALLDAVGELFEHDPLRERMEQTVY